MAKWKQKSGAVIETNDREATLEAAKAAGWTRIAGPPKAEKKAPAKKKA